SHRGDVVDLLGADEDTYLAAGLDGERALDALEAVGDGLEVLEPLDVGVHRLAAGARPRRADGIGDLDDRRLDAGVLDFLVVGGDAVHDLHRQVVALGDLPADAAWGPSTSWSTALPMSCSRPPILEIWTSAPTSAAMTAASRLVSTEWS